MSKPGAAVLDVGGLRERILRSAERAEGMAAPLDDAAMRWSPPGGGWSVGQVLEHLVTTDREYLAKMRPAIAAARARGGGGAVGAWKPSWVGAMIARATDPATTKPVPTPRRFRPAGPPRPDVAARFRASREELAALLEEVGGLDLRRVRLASPVSALIRLNLGDVFVVLTLHGERHLQQMERVMSAPGFPGGPAGR